MSEPISVNPQVLRWARTSLGLSQEEVAQRMNKKAKEVDTWERGEASPTYVQLEKLAYKIYKRPIALFFFPEVPEEEIIEQEFRTLPEDALLSIPPWMRYLLRKAKVLQLNLDELYGVSIRQNAGYCTILILLPLLPLPTWLSKSVLIWALNSLNNRHGKIQRTLSNIGGKCWRNAEFLFLRIPSIRLEGRRWVRDDIPFSGFCLYDPDFPIIYVNNNNAKSRQIFTLFHELAHLLMHTGGIDTRQDNYIEHMTGDRVEMLCNLFAAEFLVPSHDFEAHFGWRLY